MAVCKRCGVEYEAKRSTSQYCGDACRLTAYKNAKQLRAERNAKVEEVETVNTCRYCGAEIDHRLVCCMDCATSGKAEAARAGSYPPTLTDRTPNEMETDLHTATLTRGYELTEYEKQHYKPASQLASGQYNPVSKPGDVDYEGTR